MKVFILSMLACSTIALTGYTFADEGCGGGSCGTSECNPYESTCQCSDPICSKPMYSNCISRAYCCEAFGNIGAR